MKKVVNSDTIIEMLKSALTIAICAVVFIVVFAVGRFIRHLQPSSPTVFP